MLIFQIYKALHLIQKSILWSKGKFNQKLNDFMQACAAFAFISLVDLPSKEILTVGMHTAQITMQAGFSALTDSVILKLLEHIEKRAQNVHSKYAWVARITLYDIYKSLVSLLLTLPDNPETDHFLLVFKLLDILEKSDDFKKENVLLIIDLYSHVIHFLAI